MKEMQSLCLDVRLGGHDDLASALGETPSAAPAGAPAPVEG
jgi:hypothetical protein